MAACCPPGSIGFSSQSVEPLKGEIREIPAIEGSELEPLQCYVVGIGTKRVVLVFSDVFGIDSGNHKRFCDQLAERIPDSTILLPDLFRGNPILQPRFLGFLPESLSLALDSPNMLYKLKYLHGPTAIEGDLKSVLLPYVTEKFQDAKLGCVGFCYGGYVVGHALSKFDNHFAAGVGIHPSFQPEYMHGGTPVELAERINAPMLLLPAGNDDHMKPDSAVVEILKSKPWADDSEVSILFDTMVHGWVTRGDGETDKTVAECQEKALQLTVEYLLRFI